MGGCAVGALAVTTGAELPATLAAVGVAAALGLARWRVSVALACALVGLAALGELPVLAIVPLAAAVWLREPDAEPGPEFSPVVLAAILGYAATALTLLVVGQFVSLPPVAATLATVTVLTGHGARGTDRHRPPAGQRALRRHRRPDGPREPPPPARPARATRSATPTARSRCC